jgi:hypothetical protein
MSLRPGQELVGASGIAAIEFRDTVRRVNLCAPFGRLIAGCAYPE